MSLPWARACINTHLLGMSLDKRIAELEEEIRGYVTRINDSVEKDQEALLAGLIQSARETLNKLLDQSLQRGKSVSALHLFF